MTRTILKKKRHEYLLRKIKQNPFLKDEELAQACNVSVSTIRFDRAELGIAEYRERIKSVAEEGLVADTAVGEVLDLNLYHDGISVLKTDDTMTFDGTDIIKGQCIYAFAENLALSVIDAKAALVKIANVKYMHEAHAGERLIAKSDVMRVKDGGYIVRVVIKANMNEVVGGKMKIIVDAMGGDNAPMAPVEAAVRAVKELDVEIVLVGKKEVVEKELSAYDYPNDKISIANADEVITNHEEPAKAVRSKKNASVVVAANMLKKGEGDAMLSMGNTGALLASGLLIVGRIKGILRPALATLLPSAKGPKMLIDAGANTNCKPENLVQFGIMGSIYMKNVLGIESPTVGLMSNGEEEGKGDELTKETFPLLKKAPINFIGNIEGRDVMEGTADVITCDGFVGNVILKTVEGMGHVVSTKVKNIFMKNLFTKLGAIFVMGGLNEFKQSMDYREYGGAPLLGTKRPVIKGHGSSDGKAVFSAIRQAKKFVETNLIEEIVNNINCMEEKSND